MSEGQEWRRTTDEQTQWLRQYSRRNGDGFATYLASDVLAVIDDLSEALARLGQADKSLVEQSQRFAELTQSFRNLLTAIGSSVEECC